MKHPEKKSHIIQKETRNVRHTTQNTKVQRIADTLLFDWNSEFSLPSLRAVWSVADRNKASEEEARRRKRK